VIEKDPTKHSSALRLGTQIQLFPSKMIFKIPDDWLAQHIAGKDNMHLARAELAQVAHGFGEIHSDFATICNTVLPFDQCAAQVGDEPWNSAVGGNELQLRVYDLNYSIEDLEARIRQAGADEVKRFLGATPDLKEQVGDPWRRITLSYPVRDGDALSRNYVDFHYRRISDRTLAFVFMYYTSDIDYRQTVTDILESVAVKEK
jgi:hypothetical protein